MMPLLLACAASVSLHWFVLSQWPSPVVRVPIWRSSEPLEVVYLPPAPEPAQAAPSTKAVAVAPRPAPTSRPAPAPPTPRRVTQTLRRPPAASGTVLAPRTVPDAAPPAKPVPSLLTPADFAQFQYKQRVRQVLQRAIAYPMDVGLTRGSTRLRLTISRNGQVKAAACQAADAPRFEEATLDGVMAAAPFGPFPRELSAEELTFDFRVTFTPGVETSVSP